MEQPLVNCLAWPEINKFPMGRAGTGMQLGLSHLSGTPPRGLCASKQTLMMELMKNGQPAGAREPRLREAGSGQTPRSLPKNSGNGPQDSQLLDTCHPSQSWVSLAREEAATENKETC